MKDEDGEENKPNRALEFIERSERNRKKRERESIARFSFDDPFAPASVVLRGTRRELENEPGARLAMYGDDVFALMNKASSWAASEFDLPPVLYIPSQGVRLLDDRMSCIAKIESVVENLEEQSLQWVALAVYYRLVWLSDREMAPILRERSMAIAGALAAQYAAMVHNKEHADKHRERIRFASNGGKNRALSAKEHQERQRVFDKHRKIVPTDMRAAEKAIEELGLKSARTGEPLKPNSLLRVLREWRMKNQ